MSFQNLQKLTNWPDQTSVADPRLNRPAKVFSKRTSNGCPATTRVDHLKGGARKIAWIEKWKHATGTQSYEIQSTQIVRQIMTTRATPKQLAFGID